jgi:hypothetical protein
VLAIATASDYLQSDDLYILTQNGFYLMSGDASEPLTLRLHEEISFGKILIKGDLLFVHSAYYAPP